MSLRLFKDINLTDVISEGGSQANPDSDTYNGTTGEYKDRQLFLANEQTTLLTGVDASTPAIPLAAARFQDGQVIIVDNEQMLIQSGGGSTSLAVQRDSNGTTPASHDAAAPVYTAYNYTSLVVQPVDVDSTSSEVAWIRLSTSQAGLDAAIPGSALNMGDKEHDETKSFWRRITVPPATSVQNKTDLALRVAGIENPVVP